MSNGCRRRMIRLAGPSGTTGTGGTGRTGVTGWVALLCFSGDERSGVGCEKNALIPWPVDAFRLVVSSSSSMGGRLLAMDDLLHNGHVRLRSFMFRLIY